MACTDQEVAGVPRRRNGGGALKAKSEVRKSRKQAQKIVESKINIIFAAQSYKETS